MPNLKWMKTHVLSDVFASAQAVERVNEAYEKHLKGEDASTFAGFGGYASHHLHYMTEPKRIDIKATVTAQSSRSPWGLFDVRFRSSFAGMHLSKLWCMVLTWTSVALYLTGSVF